MSDNNSSSQILEICTALQEFCRQVEALEGYEEQIRNNPRLFARQYDKWKGHLKFRIGLTFGATVDYFIGKPNVLNSGQYLRSELTAQQVSQYLNYPQTNVYRFLSEEQRRGNVLQLKKEKYRILRKEPRGRLHAFKYVSTEKMSAAISNYEQVKREYETNPDLAKMFCSLLVQSGLLERSLRCMFKLQRDFINALGPERLFEFVSFCTPAELGPEQSSFEQGFEAYQKLFDDDDDAIERTVQDIMSRARQDPLIGLKHWLDEAKLLHLKG